MVLFLGAGINLEDNKEMDLSWDGLLNGLFSEAFSLLSIGKGFSSEDREVLQNLIHNMGKKEVVKGFSEDNWKRLQSYASSEFPHLVQASIIKSVLGNSYINSIRKYLYQQCDKYMVEKIFLKYYSMNTDESDTDGKKPSYVAI